MAHITHCEGGTAMPELLRDASRRVVGARQVLRAVAAGNAERVFIARDADPFIT